MDKLLIFFMFWFKKLQNYWKCNIIHEMPVRWQTNYKRKWKARALTHLTISAQLRMAQMQFPEEIIRKQIPNKNPVSKVNILQRWLCLTNLHSTILTHTKSLVGFFSRFFPGDITEWPISVFYASNMFWRL